MWFKLQIPYHLPLNQWLLGATKGNQGQKVIHFQSSETINHLKWVQHIKIWLKLTTITTNRKPACGILSLLDILILSASQKLIIFVFQQSEFLLQSRNSWRSVRSLPL